MPSTDFVFFSMGEMAEAVSATSGGPARSGATPVIGHAGVKVTDARVK